MLLKTEAPKIYISFCLPDGISAFWPREKGLRSGSWEVGWGPPGSQVAPVLLSKWKDRSKWKRKRQRNHQILEDNFSHQRGTDSGSQNARRHNPSVCSLRKCFLFLCALANSGWNARVAMATSFFFFFFLYTDWSCGTQHILEATVKSSQARSSLAALGVMENRFFGGPKASGSAPLVSQAKCHHSCGWG